MKPAPMVGVRDLRARLSAYLRSVSRGASVTISNRRRQPVARLVPVIRSAESELLDRLAERGVLRRGVGKPGRSPPVKPRKARRLLSDIVTEARAALTRHRREDALSAADLRRAVRELDREWGTYNVIDLTDSLVRSAGALAERHALRGYDAVQLAAALDLRASGGTVEFCAFDTRPNHAARRERLVVPHV